MPKRKEFEQQVWQAFVEACGNRCNLCLKEDVPLESGHLLSDNDEGSSTLDNLIPLCRSCNASHREGLSQDLRPDDWRDRFLKRWLTMNDIGLTAKISAPTENQCADSTALQVTENTRLIDWHSVVFVKADSLLLTTTDRPLLPEPEAAALVEEMILAGRKSGLIAPPLMQRKGKVIRLARFGREKFRAACEAFFYQMPWEQSGYGDAWAFLCDNFGMYVSEGLATRKRKAEQRQRDRDDETRRRWEVYQQAGECRDWHPMSDDDRAFRDKARSEKDARVISDEEFECAQEMPGKEFRAKKTRCEDFLNLCSQMIEASDELRGNYSTEYLREGLKKANSVTALHDLHDGIRDLYAILRQYSGPQQEGGEELF